MMLLVIYSHNSFAQDKTPADNNGNNALQDSLSKLTNEEYNAYFDSIYDVQLPQVQIVNLPSDGKNEVLSQRQQQEFSYSNSYVPNSVTINTSRAVGQIEIQSGVTPSGAKTYTVPINSYKFDGVFCPEISLNYNSQAGSCGYGKGWSLGGLQSISRGNKSIYYDGKTDGIKMNADDIFYLNGMRLVNISGNEYETEQGNIKAVAITDGDVVKYFNVYYPNGYTAQFGMTNTTSNKLEYPITTLTDERRRNINYYYISYNDTYNISYIVYDNGNACILFTYTPTRADYVQGYRGGMLLDNRKLLKSIVCTRSSSEIGTYSLSYVTNDGTSLLEKIDYSVSGNYLNPLQFYYGDNSAIQGYYTDEANVFSGYTYSSRSALNAVRGRFDYLNGNDGLIVYPNKAPFYHVTRDGGLFYHSQNYILNTYNANDTALIYTELDPNRYVNLTYKKTLGDNFITILTADLDGERQESIIRVNNGVSDNYDDLSFTVFAKSAIGVFQRYETRHFYYSTVHTDNDDNKSIKPKFFYTGDFNGDGKMEVMAVSADNPYGETGNPSTCYIYDLNNNTTLYSSNLLHFQVCFAGNQQDPLTANNNSDKLFPIDYNGDGKTDLIHINSSGTDIYEFSVNGSSWTAQKIATYTGLSRSMLENRSINVGDYNGDGLMDFIVSSQRNSLGNSTWTFYFSKGDGSFMSNTSQGPNCQDTASDFISQDIDGDGITDLVEVTDYSFKGYMVKNNELALGATQSLPHTKSILVPVSLYSSSLFTQFVSLYGTQATLYTYKTNRKTDQALTGVANSLGVVEKNYYHSLSSSNMGIYSNTATHYAEYPYCNMFEAIPVVAGDEVFAVGGTRNQYQYHNAVAHRQGLGFCGFETIITTDKRGQERTTVYDPYNHSVVKHYYSPEETVEYTNSVTVDSYKRLISRVTSKSVYNHLKGISYSTAYTYDIYGQMLTDKTILPGNITVYKSYVYSNFTDITNKYHLGRLSSYATSTTRGSSTHVEQKGITSYNSNDQPLTIVDRVNGNVVSTTNLVYDNDGNITTKSVYPYSSATAQTTTYQWATGNRLSREVNPVGVWKTYIYNTDGTVQKTNSHIGETVYTYDAFGRQIKEVFPDGTEHNTSYEWSSTGSGVYSITESGTNIPTETTSYNALNKKLNSLLTRFDNNQLTTIRAYDNYGNLVAESTPYRSTTPVIKTYTYDTHNRVTQKVEGGKRTSITYNGLSTTVSDGTMSSTTTTDALGGVVSVTDNAGTISYTLNAAGNPTAIYAPSSSGSVSTTITYDGYGRKASIVDSSHGTTTYTYHSTEGYLKKEKNARNQETLYEYDAYRRLSKKTSPEFYTTYTYNNDLNKITAETSSNGTSTIYSYDAFGRLSSVRENAVDSKWLRKDYTYNDGNVSAIQYTSQGGPLTTENYYYANGYLTSVKLNSTVTVFQLTSEDNFGHASNVSTLGVIRSYGFTGSGLSTFRNASYNNQSIQDLTYSFNPTTCNLTSIYDARNGFTEDFDYDNLHRLTNYGGTAVTYDDNGNILTKGDIGTFSYEITGKPYAVSKVILNSNIPVGTQNVSYYSFDRPSMITDNGYTANFTYNGNFDRVKMEMLHNSTSTLTRYYLGGCYELDVKPSGNTEKLYLMEGYYDAPVALVKQNGSISYYNIIRDHLGSIVRVTGNTSQELSYDAWGRLRDPSTHALYSPANEPELILGRGYCGHEHLPGLGLINMNARLYDPLLGRFLSSDPYVQAPELSQSFNRYSYCMNNPLLYKDENGEFLLSLISGFIKGTIEFVSGNGKWYSPFYRAYKNTANDIKITWGLFKGDTKQIMSRFTWEWPQTLLGMEFSKLNLIFHDVDKIRYYDGATYVINKKGNAAGTTGSTLGSFINITTDESIPMDEGKFAPYAHPVYAHEYGHYLQSQSVGPGYLFKYGIPSVIDFYKNKNNEASYLNRYGYVLSINKHHIHDAEIDANQRAAQYFSKKGVLYYNSEGWNYEWTNPTYAIVL